MSGCRPPRPLSQEALPGDVEGRRSSVCQPAQNESKCNRARLGLVGSPQIEAKSTPNPRQTKTDQPSSGEQLVSPATRAPARLRVPHNTLAVARKKTKEKTESNRADVPFEEV